MKTHDYTLVVYRHGRRKSKVIVGRRHSVAHWSKKWMSDVEALGSLAAYLTAEARSIRMRNNAKA